MKLGIVSWNIRHLRPDKVNTYLKYIMDRIADARLVVLYENKTDNNKNDELCGLLANEAFKVSPPTSIQFMSFAVSVGTNENVVVLYTNKIEAGPNSSTPGTKIKLNVSHDNTWDQQLNVNGMKAMKSSYNETVMSNLSIMRDEFRIPAVLSVTMQKQGAAAKTFRMAAWHAPGPATALAPLLWNAYANILYNDVDLFVGDFNMTGLREQHSTISPITLMRTNQSTTITPQGPVNHAEGLDLVWRNRLKIATSAADMTAVNHGFIGRATVSVKNPGANLQLAHDVSDHLPVYIELKEL